MTTQIEMLDLDLPFEYRLMAIANGYKGECFVLVHAYKNQFSPYVNYRVSTHGAPRGKLACYAGHYRRNVKKAWYDFAKRTSGICPVSDWHIAPSYLATLPPYKRESRNRDY